MPIPKKLTFVQRIMLQHANPKKFVCDSFGILVALYLFWEKNWIWAIILIFAFSFLGTLIAWGRDEAGLARTRLGKWMIGQAHPVNMIVRLIGAVTIAYGAWAHSFLFIAIGIVLVVVARHWVLKLSS